MKFVVSSSEFLSHLQAISRAISSKSQYPILDCFLLDLQGSTLNITASDLEVTMTTHLAVDSAEGDSKVAFPSKMLLEILRKLPEQPLTFQVNSDNLMVDIISEKGKYNFVGQPGSEYPEIPTIEDSHSLFLMHL